MKLPTLYTERLMIRPLSVLDADDMYEYAKTPLVGPMAGWPPHTSLSDTINVIKIMSTIKTPYELGAWAIVLKSNQKMITFSFIIGNNLITINYSTYTIITAKIINRGKPNE